MLYAALDVSKRQVADIIYGGEASQLLQELVTLYNTLTKENIRSFSSADVAKEKCKEAIQRLYFQETNQHLVTPPWARTDTPSPSVVELKRAIGPVALAREVFESMKGERRKDVIEACVKLGVKRSTASTQYQIWKSSHN